MSVMRSSIFAVVLALLCLNACTAVHFNTIPQPPPTNKLRVFIMPVTGAAPRGGTKFGWANTHEQFKKIQFRAISNYLKDTGIYEIVSEEEIRASLGTQDFAVWQWLSNDMALAKQAGKALHADYAIVSIRNVVSGGDYESKIVCVNLETGKQYTNSFYVSLASISLSSINSREKFIAWSQKMFHEAYRKMFHDVKEDLLATAIRKGHLLPKEEIKKPGVPPEVKVALAPPPAPQSAPKPPTVAVEQEPAPAVETPVKPVSPASVLPEKIKKPALPPEVKVALAPPPAPQPAPKPPTVAVEQEPAPVVETPVKPVSPVFKPPEEEKGELPDADKYRDAQIKLEEKLQEAKPTPGKARLVVYDFDAVEHLNVVALILTEALREELFILGQFTLVNRENMIQVLEELKLQQSGLVNESQAVKLGKWLAANEAVSGRLAILGNAYVLQAKRIDISTMGTLGRGSLKCTAGHEEELLSGMPVLAKKLVDTRK